MLKRKDSTGQHPCHKPQPDATKEDQAVLRDEVMPKSRVKLGSLLAEIGKEIQLTDEELANFERDRTPHIPIKFD